MSNSLTYCDLPAEISQWPGLPLSLSGDEVMPLDYRAGNTGWLLYGRKLDKARITQFQRKLGAAMGSSPPGAWTTIRWCGWREP